MGVLLEIGSVKKWERIRIGIGNAILLESTKITLNNNSGWIDGIKKNLETNGMLNFFENPPDSAYPFIHERLFERLYYAFHLSAIGEINTASSK